MILPRIVHRPVSHQPASKRELILIFTGCYIFCILCGAFFIFLLRGSVEDYTRLEHLKSVAVSTLCTIYKYRFTNRTCQITKHYSRPCYDEQFKVTYQLRHGLSKNGTIYTEARRFQSATKIGSSYPCWYDPNNRTNIFWTIESNEIHHRNIYLFSTILVIIILSMLGCCILYCQLMK